MNPYLETLKDELREECGEDICQADWYEFWDAMVTVENCALGQAAVINHSAPDDRESMIDYGAVKSASYAQGTRADLTSIVKYAYAAIEENLK